jgi:neopullulanase
MSNKPKLLFSLPIPTDCSRHFNNHQPKTILNDSKLMRILSILLVLLVSTNSFAQYAKVYPSHWWVGMKNNKLQLLIKGEYDQFANEKLIINYPGVKVNKVTPLENKMYLAVDLTIAPNCKPGKFPIAFSNEKDKGHAVEFELKARQPRTSKYVTSEDFIYLIMPDRFANGDESNDRVPGMLDQSLNRDTVFNRHGGDLQGIIDHLDYLQDLGVTTLWLNPVLENNTPERTEHGYAITDHYKVDPRLGTNELYKKLSDALHKRGMKLIQDAVYNHVGAEHWFIKDKPAKDWVHNWPKYTNTTYKDQVLMDPYASSMEKKIMSDGWFTTLMPDLNQGNPYLANFLIQHAIFCTEEFALDGWRIDTYAYNDLDFMNRCNSAILNEYPGIYIFGETWVHGIPNQSFFMANNYNIPYKSNLPGVTDFQQNLYGILPALNEPFGWTNGVGRMYLTASNDFVYKDPSKLCTFLSNHDIARFYSSVNEDLAKYKMGTSWLLTFRGTPQWYYGDELLMTGFTNPDGNVRRDFLGGWKADKQNKFTAAGRTAKEEEAYQHLKKMANFRKTSSAIKTGKMMQYVPVDGVYVYFRYDANQTVMCVMNSEETSRELNMQRFAERTKGFSNMKHVLTGEVVGLPEQLKVEGKQLLVAVLLQ